MPVAQSQLDALRTYILQGELYHAVTAPTDPAALTMTNGVPAGTGTGSLAISMGLTSGPAELVYKPDFKGVEVEQAYGEVAPRVVKETVTLKFKCAEATYKRIKVALQTGTYIQSGPASSIYKHYLNVGGLTFFAVDCVALVSNITGPAGGSQGNLTKYEWVVIYNAMSVDGLKLDWKRGETRMVEVMITGYADVTRPEGDQLFQLGQDGEASDTTGL